jgi:hypothetical protein
MTEGWRCNGSVSRKTAPFPGKRSRFPENGATSRKVGRAARETAPFPAKLPPLPKNEPVSREVGPAARKVDPTSRNLPALPGNRPCFPESWPRCRKNGRPAPSFPSPSGEGGVKRRMRGAALAQNLHLHPLQSVEAATGSLGPHVRSFVSRPILIPSALIRRAGYRGADISEHRGVTLFAAANALAPRRTVILFPPRRTDAANSRARAHLPAE